MISVEPQKDGNYAVSESGRLIGTVAVSHNPFHARNAYLKLGLQQYDDAAAPELFRCLRETLEAPMQVMLESGEERLALFLTAGGFKRKRRCYETEASMADLKAPLSGVFPLRWAAKGAAEYRLCCEAQYKSYVDTHESVNPLTAELTDFCRILPDTAVFHVDAGCLLHWAFVEENEIAYIGTGDIESFCRFAATLLAELLTRYGTVRFEADDCDPAAMALRAFFDLPDAPFCDTYVYP